MADDIDTTARNLLDCVCDRLAIKNEEINRPVCKCYATIGPPIVVLCCECEVEDSEQKATGEATIHFERLYDADPTTLEQVSRVHPCKRSTTVADFTIVVTRCYPMINEAGEMPDSEDQDAAATDMHSDISDVFAALTCGCNGYPLIVQEIAVDSMPEAGCAVLSARISVEVKA